MTSSFIVRLRQEHRMARIKVNLTLDAEVAETARALGLNMSRLAEAAIAEATKAERNRLWREENRAALASYAEEVARDGLPLAGLRSF
jgi:antitoxin CcdA